MGGGSREEPSAPAKPSGLPRYYRLNQHFSKALLWRYQRAPASALRDIYHWLDKATGQTSTPIEKENSSIWLVGFQYNPLEIKVA
jgi:hypothetical protein